MTIFMILLSVAYLLSGIFTRLGLLKLATGYTHPGSRTFGFNLLVLGAAVRFITLLLAWLNGLPLYMACIAQFIPLAFFILFFLLYDKINAIQKQ